MPTEKHWPLLENKEWLYERYVVDQLTQAQIAKLQVCSVSPVKRWLKIHGIEFRNRGALKREAREVHAYWPGHEMEAV